MRHTPRSQRDRVQDCTVHIKPPQGDAARFAVLSDRRSACLQLRVAIPMFRCWAAVPRCTGARAMSSVAAVKVDRARLAEELPRICADASRSNVKDVVELIAEARAKRIYVDASNFAGVLAALVDAGSGAEALAQWSWMQHSLAARSTAARSAVVRAHIALGDVAAATAEAGRVEAEGLRLDPAAVCGLIGALGARPQRGWSAALQLVATHAGDTPSAEVVAAAVEICLAAGRAAAAADLVSSMTEAHDVVPAAAADVALRVAIRADSDGLLRRVVDKTDPAAVAASPATLGLEAAGLALLRDRDTLRRRATSFAQLRQGEFRDALLSLVDSLRAADWSTGKLAVATIAQATQRAVPDDVNARVAALHQAAEADHESVVDSVLGRDA